MQAEAWRTTSRIPGPFACSSTVGAYKTTISPYQTSTHNSSSALLFPTIAHHFLAFTLSHADQAVALLCSSAAHMLHSDAGPRSPCCTVFSWRHGPCSSYTYCSVSSSSSTHSSVSSSSSYHSSPSSGSSYPYYPSSACLERRVHTVGTRLQATRDDRDQWRVPRPDDHRQRRGPYQSGGEQQAAHRGGRHPLAWNQTGASSGLSFVLRYRKK